MSGVTKEIPRKKVEGLFVFGPFEEVLQEKSEGLMGLFCTFYYIYLIKMKLCYIHPHHTNVFGPLKDWDLSYRTPNLCLGPTLSIR